MAGIELATAYVSLVVSGDKVAPGVKKALAGVEGEASRAGTRSGKAYGDSMTKGVGASAKRMAAGIGAAFAAVKAVSFLGDSITAASDLAENQSKVGVVFDQSAAKILAASKTSASAMGLSTNAYLDATGTLGNLLVSLDIVPAKAAVMSQQMVKLAGDLASFNNVSPEEALLALKSGLTGETEPLKRFGVNMNDATLKAEALKLGLIANVKEAMTPQTKALAAQKLIMEQTGTAQGDFERTSKGLANQQRILAAQVDDTKAKLGEAFLPAVTNVVEAMNDAIPAVVGTAKAVGSLPGPVKAAAAAWLIYVAAQKLGITGAVAGGFTRMTGVMDTMRIRTMLAADAFKSARAGQLQLTNGSGKLIAPVGRMSSAMAGLGAAAVGAGGAMRRGLGGVVGMLGGPWGAAFIAAAVIATAFISKQKKQAAAVKEMTAALDQQTGAITAANKESIGAALRDSGAIAAAEQLGLNLRTVQKAAEGSVPAAKELTAQLDAMVAAERDGTNQSQRTVVGHHDVATAVGKVRDAYTGQNKVIRESQRDLIQQGLQMGTNAGQLKGTATLVENSAVAMKAHADAMARDAAAADKAAAALQRFLDKLDAQRARALQASGGMIAYEASLDAAAASLTENGRTLDIGTEKGRANQTALDDIAGAWNNLTTHQQNAKGAFKTARDALVKQAEAFGDTKKEARAYADRVLEIPRKISTKVHIDDVEAKAKLKALRQAARDRKMKIRVQFELTGGNTAVGGIRAKAGGGPVTRGRPYVVGEHRRELFIPNQSGRIEPSVPAAKAGGNTYNTTVVADDPWGWKRSLDHMARAEALGGADFR